MYSSSLDQLDLMPSSKQIWYFQIQIVVQPVAQRVAVNQDMCLFHALLINFAANANLVNYAVDHHQLILF